MGFSFEEAVEVAEPARVSQTRVRDALRRSWQILATRPFAAATCLLVQLVASVLVPLGVAWRLEALHAAFARLGRNEAPELGRIVAPPKLRAAWDRGVWWTILAALRADLAIVLLTLVLAVFFALPAALLWPIGVTLEGALGMTFPDMAELAWLPAGLAGIAALGALSIALLTAVQLEAAVPVEQLGSAVHARALGAAVEAMRRHAASALAASVVPAALALGFGIVGGLFFKIATEVLPLSSMFLVTAIGLPALLGFVAFNALFSWQVAEGLASTVDTKALDGASAGLTARFWAAIRGFVNRLSSAGQLNVLVLTTFAVALLLLGGAFIRGFETVSFAHALVIGAVLAACTVLAAVNARKEGRVS